MGKPKTKTKPPRRSRIPAVVPKVVFSTIFVGVVPACVISACAGGSTQGTTSEAGSDRQAMGVAQRCFGPTDPTCQMAVAAVAFQCFDGSTQPGCPQPVDAAFDSDDGPDDASDADGAG